MAKKTETKKISWWEKYREIIFFKILFLLSALRFVIFGFKYFPQLQDYRNYYGYNALFSGFPTSLLITRPLHGVFNYFVWSKFWGLLIIPALIMAALLTASAWLLYKVCTRRFGSGVIFATIIALSSTTLEGTYWLTASTRVVSGLFFASLAIFFFDRFLSSDKKRNIILAGVFGLICICFHEQAFVFATVFAIILTILDKKNLVWPTSFLVACTAIYLVITKGGEWQPMVFPINGKYFTYYLPIAFRQFGKALITAPLSIITTGFGRGIQIMFSEGIYWYLLTSALLIAAAIFFSKSERKKSNLGIFLGLALIIAPLLSFLFLRDAWVSLWTTVLCLPGIALAFDSFLSGFKKGYPVILGIIMVVFMVSSVSEIYDYKLTCEDDQRIVTDLANTLRSMWLDQVNSIVILGIDSNRLETQNYPYHEHIQGIGSNDKLFKDAYCAVNKTYLPQSLTPVPEGKSVSADSVMNGDLYLNYSEGNVAFWLAVKNGNEIFLEDENYHGGRIYINSEGYAVFVKD